MDGDPCLVPRRHRLHGRDVQEGRQDDIYQGRCVEGPFRSLQLQPRRECQARHRHLRRRHGQEGGPEGISSAPQWRSISTGKSQPDVQTRPRLSRCESGSIWAARRSKASRSTEAVRSRACASTRHATTMRRPSRRSSSIVADLERAAGSRGTVGVGIPGTQSPDSGLVKNANSTWLIGRPLKADLERALAREVRIANDANCFAVSEATDGAAAGADVVFGVIVGTGTGAGIIVHGRVLTGPNGIAGEWGHNPLPWADDDEVPGPLVLLRQARLCRDLSVRSRADARSRAAHRPARRGQRDRRACGIGRSTAPSRRWRATSGGWRRRWPA